MDFSKQSFTFHGPLPVLQVPLEGRQGRHGHVLLERLHAARLLGLPGQVGREGLGGAVDFVVLPLLVGRESWQWLQSRLLPLGWCILRVQR